MTFAPTDPVALAQALIRCESVTPHEGGALTLLQNVLEPMGFVCHRMTFSEPGTPDVDNLYARLGTGRPHLCFAGHTDVVPVGDESKWTVPPFAGEIRDGILYGRGAVDMKGCVAAFAAAALRYLGQHNGLPRGSLSFLITGDEEGPSINGTVKVLDWMKARDEVLDACLVGEPSNPKALGDEIRIGRRGSINIDIVVHGKQGHSAYPKIADNPVPKLARIIDRLSSAKLDEGTPNFEPSNVQVTVISVPNTASNVIPGLARATVNIRYNDAWTRPKIEAWVRDTTESAAKELGAKFDLVISGTGDVFLTKPGPLVSTLRDAVKSVTGRVPALTTGGGTSDARFIKDHCPVVEFGLVNATIHQVDERTSVADLEALTDIYGRFIGNYFAGA
ncbi:MAG: succinyl-diaminopimelate desuccinylase [Hyphomicrobium sp.]|nr:MAG: succinyl-diaminopimelate desuccinylase [Hyphomicrobium sp.]PPC98754.1 MAG: succinyl-diaminopimelate desuccinylase [Hyphomicrobium sp.]